MEVVLPEPLTPAIMMTNGLAREVSSGRSSGASSSVMASFNASSSAAPSSIFCLRARARSDSISQLVADTPQSACSRAVSSSSYSASSILRRVKSSETGVLRTSRVRARPALRRAAQESDTMDA